MAQSMGIGALGAEQAIFKRKFRWTFEIIDTGGFPVVTYGQGNHNSKTHFCKLASRPSFKFNEQEVQHVSEKVYLPAKPEWDPVNITVYDLRNNDSVYIWLLNFYQPADGIIRPVAAPLGATFPKKIARLYLLDGHGRYIEAWEFQGCWPISINFGDLDYSSSEELTVEFSMRYDRAIQLELNLS